MSNIPNCYYRTSIKALILDDQKRFLLLKEEGGKWDLPGGGLDWGESVQSCLSREIQEEMGIKAISIAENPSYFTSSASDVTPEQWITNIIYIAKVDHLNFAQSNECVEIGFFSAIEAREKNLHSNVLKFTELYNLENH